MSTAPVAVVESLEVALMSGRLIVKDVGFSVQRGEVLAIVGESGSGKTTTSLALLGYARSGVRIMRGSVQVDGMELLGRAERDLRELRGAIVSYVPQDPAAALNPARRIGTQIRDVVLHHLGQRGSDELVDEILGRVHLPSDVAFKRRFPFELSGGQQQRVAIAMALACSPRLAVLDEPTTGLDVVTQHHILAEIDRLRQELELSVVYVSHDLAVVSNIADRVLVMYDGAVVEAGRTEDVLARPKHPYTRGLIASTPDHRHPRRLRGIPGVLSRQIAATGCSFANRCNQRVPQCDVAVPPLFRTPSGSYVRCYEWTRTPPVSFEPPVRIRTIQTQDELLEVEGLTARYVTRRGVQLALSQVSFQVARGQCVALVGESGSGKTTAARCITGLLAPASGSIRFNGQILDPLAKDRPVDVCRKIQMIFQNPYDSLNPRRTVGDTVARPAQVLQRLPRRESHATMRSLLERVRLPMSIAHRFPRELSGGERQRVAIARALAANPTLIVCDEITSALDVSVQAAVLELLGELRVELGVALIFISHDLGVVSSVADWALVLNRGSICERGRVEDLLLNPRDEYTRTLLASAPRLAI